MGLDRAIATLRWTLLSARDDAAARAHVLPALARCTVLVPTLGAPDALRFLPQSGGEQALPLFTGHDALEHAAKKLGWAAGTASVSFRAMSARDALNAAVRYSVACIALDVGAEHALELSIDDVSHYLSHGTGEFSPEGFASVRRTGEQRLSDMPGVRGTGEHVLPRGSRAPQAQPRSASGGGAPRDPRREPDALTAAFEPTQPQARAQTQGAKRPRDLAMIDDPFASAVPRRAPTRPLRASGGVVQRANSLTAPLPRQSEAPAQAPSRPSKRPASAPASAPMGVTESSSDPPDQWPSLPSLPPLVAEEADMSSEDFGFGVDDAGAAPARESTPESPARAASAQPRSNRPREETEPLATVASQPAPRTGRTWSGHAPAPEPFADGAQGAGSEASAAGMPASAPPAAVAVAVAVAAAPRPKPATPTTVDEPIHLLDDSVLAPLADELRKFPEVEWACEVSDGGDCAVIAVRVQPSYLTRAQEIESLIDKAARGAGVRPRPLLLIDPTLTKAARAKGRMFFPWRKKK